ncbi:MAG: hypothetical protein JXB03_12240 [Spirochaetales bacterium]|nr:hypothetical protein [Spirochaetales bacterium]
MQYRSCLFFFSLLLLCPSCHTWQRNITVGEVSYSKFRYTGRERESEYAYSIGMLAEVARVNGLMYKGYLHLRGNGTVSGGILAQPVFLCETLFPENTWVSFSPEGWLETCALPDSMDIQGFPVLGTGGGVKGAHASFYPSGDLRLFFTGKDMEVDGIPCKGGLLSYIELYSGGRLKKCTLSRDVVIDGILYRKGSGLKLTETGRILAE